jgi:hypothetical protein
MQYELWHVETANLMDDFDDEAEALDAARAYLTPDEAGVVVDVALMVYDGDRRVRSIHGDELARLVFDPPPGEIRQSA